ncbi:MAG: aminotransferase class V-fold PLP-dependent enzyme [Phycisphaeraceae bacterium]|nr:aminotransferase class V-fold PLP-dependent enzyme [Phycisphaeraceae bacterium]
MQTHDAECLHFHDITHAVSALGDGPLTENALRSHIHPLFSRVMERQEIYLSNHSLGRPLDRVSDDVARFASLWQRDMDSAWGAWLAEIHAFRAMLARVIGVSSPDAVVPKTSAGQGLRAVLNALPPSRSGGPHQIVATRAEFDSIDFILKTYQTKGHVEIRWVETRDGLVHEDDVIRAIGSRTDLVVVSHVVFATGQLLDRVGDIVSAAHAAGALCLVDMYHSAGVVPLDMQSMGADFAIGGSYKYFRGGPGAGWLAIHPRHLATEQPTLRTLDTGWFAKKDTFGFARTETPLLASGGDAWMECTPSPISAYQANAGIALVLALGVDRLRAYSIVQQSFLASDLAEFGVPVRLIEPRGAFLLVPSRDAARLTAELKQAGLSTDARGAHVRLCPDILNTRADLRQASQTIARVRSTTGL